MHSRNSHCSISISQALSENLKAETWYERLNLFGKLKRFCQYWTGTFVFWLVVAFSTLIEPVLCTNKPVGLIWFIQVIVLAISSALYVIQLIGVASREWDKIVTIQSLSSTATSSMGMQVPNFTPLKIFIFFSAEGEYILEFCCLCGGWMTIFFYPGLAVLRCFRVFRLLWFYEVEVFKDNAIRSLSPIFGVKFMKRLFKVLKFAIRALAALGSEMFRLTSATRGGLMLMIVLFYSAYVLGTALWIETDAQLEFCYSLPSCCYAVMRLAFQDGDTGFTFAYSLTENHRFLFFLCMIYVCVAALGLLNGMIGIFGTAFAVASDEAFNDSEDEDEEEDEQNGEDLDDNEGKGFEGEDGGIGAAVDKEQLRNDDDGESDLEEYDDDRSAVVPVFQRGMSRKKLEAKQLESRLKGALGSKSNFALKELQKIAEAEALQQKEQQQASRAPRRTLKDIIREKGDSLKAASGDNITQQPSASESALIGPSAKLNNTLPLEMFISPRDSTEQDKKAQQVVNKPVAAKKASKNLHAAVGMFSTMKNQKSGKNLLAGAHSSASPGHGKSHNASASGGFLSGANLSSGLPAATSADMRAMNASFHTMDSETEAQNAMLQNLIAQMETLNQTLSAIHPSQPNEAEAPVSVPIPVLAPETSSSVKGIPPFGPAEGGSEAHEQSAEL